MKKLFSLIAILLYGCLFSQNYHYTPHGHYFDNIGVENILKHSISKVEIELEDYQIITAYFNKIAQIEKIEITNKTSDIIVSSTFFKWKPDINYMFSSLSQYNEERFTFMTSISFSRIRNDDKEMLPDSATQYWLKNGSFWYGESYNLYPHLGGKKSLTGAIYFKYLDGKISSIRTDKYKSNLVSPQYKILTPTLYSQQNKKIEFIYDSLNRKKQIKNYYATNLISIESFNYEGYLLKSIVDKAENGISKTEFKYNSELVNQIDKIYTGNNYNDLITSKITCYDINDEVLELEHTKPEEEVLNSQKRKITNNSKEKNDISHTAYKTTVNLNLRSQPIVNSEVLLMIPVGSYVEVENVKNTKSQDTFEINGETITSNWVYTQYKPFKGWVFAGGLLKLKEYKGSNSDYIWEETNDNELFEKKFIYEVVYGDECNGEYAVAKKSLVRLILNIDENGLVFGEYGYVPCYESGTSYGEISGVARGNKISVIWKYSMEGMNYEEPLILIKNHESIQIVNDGDYIKENGKLLKSNPREEWLKLVSEESKN